MCDDLMIQIGVPTCFPDLRGESLLILQTAERTHTRTHTHARTVCRAFQLFGFHPTRADPKPKRQSETKIRGSARIDPSNYMTQIGSLDGNHGPELVFDLWSVTRFKQCISTYVHVFSLHKRKI